MAQELVRYTLKDVKHKYEGQTAGILEQQRQGSGHMDMSHRTRIRRKRVDGGSDGGSDEGVVSQGGSERTG